MTPAPALRILLAALAAAGLSFGAVAEEIFRWVDRDGSVHFSDMPPPASARSQEKKAPTGNASSALHNAAVRHPVILYATPDCGEACESGRALLRERRIPFAEKRVVTGGDADALKEAMGGRDPVVPMLFVGQQSARGYQRAIWNALLDAAGYPKESR